MYFFVWKKKINVKKNLHLHKSVNVHFLNIQVHINIAPSHQQMQCNIKQLGFSKAYISYFLMSLDYSIDSEKLEKSLLFVFEKLVGGCLLFINGFQY